MGKFYIDRKGRVIHNVKPGDLCPYCKVGEVLIRTGKYSNFFACSSFPRCGFTQRIEVADEDNSLECKADKILGRSRY